MTTTRNTPKDKAHAPEYNRIVIDGFYSHVPDFVDSTVGILREFYRARIHGSCPKTFLYGARLCAVNELSSRITASSPACSTGINVDRRSAVLGCVFEGLERYAASVVPVEGLVWSTEQELRDRGFECMSRGRFDYFTHEQYARERFPFMPWRPESRLRWSRCSSLTDGRDCYIPAQFVYLAYSFADGETVLFTSTSNGLACHRSLPNAVYSGLCEVIERDAFMNYWHNMLPCSKISLADISGLDPEIDLALSHTRNVPSLTLTVKDITTDTHIPTLLCILRNRHNNDAPAAAFAAATDLDPRHALRKALNEVLGTYAFTHRLRHDQEKYRNLRVDPAQWDRTYSLEDHVALYAFHEIHDYLDWIDAGEEISFQDLAAKYGALPAPDARPSLDERLAACVDRLSDVGIEAFYADITSDDIRNFGFTVARVCVPGCVPLHGAHWTRPLGCRRLLDVPGRMGFSRPEQVNQMPHPYP